VRDRAVSDLTGALARPVTAFRVGITGHSDLTDAKTAASAPHRGLPPRLNTLPERNAFPTRDGCGTGADQITV
jgi:hypothetical protein